MTEIIHEGGETLKRVDSVNLTELSMGDRLVVTTSNSVYVFEIADGSEHSMTGTEQTDYLVIRAYRDRVNGEEQRLTHGLHYRCPQILFLGSRPVDRDIRTLDELDHHKLQVGASFLVHMDGEEHNGQHIDRFEYSPVDFIEIQRA